MLSKPLRFAILLFFRKTEVGPAKAKVCELHYCRTVSQTAATPHRGTHTFFINNLKLLLINKFTVQHKILFY